jgi:NosR/NirI family nitrous oxide reductase transcriptional regulator
VRGGIYDRVQVRQDSDSFTFRDLDYVNLWGISAAGAPSFDESAIFIIRGKSFSGAYPWKLVFLGNKIDKETSTKTFANFDKEYWLADKYLEGGRPTVVKPDPTWLKVWKERAIEIGAFIVVLLAISAAYASRDTLVRRSAATTNGRSMPSNTPAGCSASASWVSTRWLSRPSPRCSPGSTACCSSGSGNCSCPTR